MASGGEFSAHRLQQLGIATHNSSWFVTTRLEGPMLVEGACASLSSYLAACSKKTGHTIEPPQSLEVPAPIVTSTMKPYLRGG